MTMTEFDTQRKRWNTKKTFPSPSDFNEIKTSDLSKLTTCL